MKSMLPRSVVVVCLALGVPVGAASAASGFSGTIELSGAVHVSGHWTDTNEAWAGSCAAWADYKVGPSSPVGRNVPGPGGPLGAKVGGHSVSLGFVFTSYKGPGTYTRDRGAKGIEVDGHTYGPPRSYRLHVAPNGGGTLSFVHAADPLDPAKVLSGSERWTCR
ncbi:MAG TPA: hypothetical protein VFB35_02790 [Gaiellaceae bacterium]|nr:hypothetical protein [Gaiellaceae bacterium]